MYKVLRSKRLWSTIWLVLAVVIFVGSFFVSRNPSLFKNLGFLDFGSYCRFPLTYQIGSFDSRFGVSEEYFKKVLAEAEIAWETKTDTELFAYDADGKLAINLIYDKRQEETEVLQKLNLSIDSSRSSFDQIKARYDQLKRSYLSGRDEYEASLGAFEIRAAKYQEDVDHWNKKGGAPKGEYERLAAEKEALVALKTALDERRLALNDLANTVNSLASSLNRLARDLNISIAQYNEGGEIVGKEFEQGVYVSDVKGVRINIYQFEDRNKLIGVLVHEMGHALGLEHNEDATSVMYRLNHGKGKQIVTGADVAALKTRCPNLGEDQ